MTTRDKELLIAPAGEGLLILIVAAAGALLRQPLVFTSLGPTGYEMVEQPSRPSARPYNIIMGHLIAVIAGFIALYVTGAASTPTVSQGVPLARVWAATIATALTVVGTLLLRATQPAALSTTLLIALGNLQAPLDGIAIMGAVLLMTIAGEPLRRLRARHQLSTVGY